MPYIYSRDPENSGWRQWHLCAINFALIVFETAAMKMRTRSKQVLVCCNSQSNNRMESVHYQFVIGQIGS